MEWKKAKNIVILVLVCANILLAGNLFFQIYEKYSVEHEAILKSIDMIKLAGADVQYEQLSKLPQNAYVYVANRDTEKEKIVATTGLGECTKSILGGGIEEYTSEAGKFIFRNGGMMSGELYGMDLKGEELKLSKRILSTLGIYSGDLHTVGNVTYGTHRIEKKYVIKNMDILLEQTTKGVKISGKWIGGDIEPQKIVKCNSLDLALAILKIKTNHPQIVKITELEIVYNGEMGSNGQLILLPVLRIDTNDGEIFLDLQKNAEIKI